MVVDMDALGNKTYTNDNFSFTVDAKGGTTNKESVFYIGTFQLSGLGSAPVSFGKVGKTTLKSDKDYVLELHYNLIKEVESAGADALLGDIAMNGRLKKSDLQTRLFGLLPDSVSKNVVYTVTGYSKTAKMVTTHQAEDNSNDGGSAGTDIKLNWISPPKVPQAERPVLAQVLLVALVDCSRSNSFSLTLWTVSCMHHRDTDLYGVMLQCNQLCIRASGPAWSTISCSFCAKYSNRAAMTSFS